MGDMTHWPIHEYDPRPVNRRLRRAQLVLGEHLIREMRIRDIIEWINRKVSK